MKSVRRRKYMCVMKKSLIWKVFAHITNENHKRKPPKERRDAKAYILLARVLAFRRNGIIDTQPLLSRHMVCVVYVCML